LNQAAASAGQIGTSHCSLVTLVLALLLGTAMLRTSGAEPLMTSAHFAWAGALLGLGALLGFGALVVQHVIACSSSTLYELQQQLGDLPRDEAGRPQLLQSFRPRYAEPLAVACERALAPRGLVVLGTTLVPWLLVACLPLLGSQDTATGRSLLLSSLFACVGVAGAALSLLSRAVFGALHSSRRSRNDATGSIHLTEGLADLSGHVLDPALQLVTKGTLAACLAIAPTLLTVH
jgi:hypothetical protein